MGGVRILVVTCERCVILREVSKLVKKVFSSKKMNDFNTVNYLTCLDQRHSNIPGKCRTNELSRAGAIDNQWPFGIIYEIVQHTRYIQVVVQSALFLTMIVG